MNVFDHTPCGMIITNMHQAWSQQAKDKAAGYDKADWRLFDAANEILDIRLWEVRKATTWSMHT